ncbi:LuxR C-terminal-related transcriptional regulator [Rhodococcus sp. IEGM 1354]|uniref:helix-turn-helix transcriptional regulator n=1 Tax=Rhodococcus sp. IEGM 1354 TaxID=3047088 RepID=UPI0024B747E4|nr:LuxR family transcriptional regulator [Rhodococcus sp. IEGM 1354]MDI9929682.1 LuxR C-terminal-related transcriptional regulator [Rhodococcus sp. IEGM 1354]
MSNDVPASTGRETEIRLLSEFVGGVLDGTGGAIIIVGEFGSGKTTVGRTAASLDGLRTRNVRARAGEHAVHLLARLIGTASHPAEADIVTVVDMVLDALTELTRTGPLLAVVDDVDLADASARKVLGTLSRRIRHLPVGLVLIGWRRGDRLPAGASVLRLHPLSTHDTASIVRGQLGKSAPDWVVDSIVVAARGNPQAAKEMSAALTAEETAGRGALADPPRPGPGWIERWRDLAGVLSVSHRTAMLVAAVGDGLPSSVLDDACGRLGVGADALESLEAMRLVRVDNASRAWSRRPHRSAVFHAADSASINAVHAALTGALSDAADPEQRLARVMHLSAPADVSAEAVGNTLERILRTAHASADTLTGWLRAAESTDDDAIRARRLVSAGLVSWLLGRPEQAEWLIGRAGLAGWDDFVAGTTAQIRGALALSQGLPADALRILTAGANAAALRDPKLAVDLAARVTGLAWWGGRADWAAQAVDLAASITDTGVYATLVRNAAPAGLAVMCDKFSPAVDDLARSLRAAEQLTQPRELLFAAEIATMVGDDIGTRRFCERAIGVMRVQGHATELPFALQLDALVLAGQGRSEAARDRAEEGIRLAEYAGEETDGAFQHTVLAHLSALDGDSAACGRHRREVAGRGDDHPTASIEWAEGRLAVSQSRFVEAVDLLVPTVLHDGRHPEISLMATPDLVEAAVAVGNIELAREASVRFERWCAAGSSWAGAVAPRLRALMAGASAEALFEEACQAPGLAHRPLEAARTRLAFGTYLRGERRRAEARQQFHPALALFESLQLPAWIDRTRSALRASGEGRSHDIVVADVLTDQELAIARMVSIGRSNRDVAGTLHLSSRTVEYHLSKVYVKLGLDSREQLAGILSD